MTNQRHQCNRCRRFYLREPGGYYVCPRAECDGATLSLHRPNVRVLRGPRPAPVGKRPKCRGCGCELKPNFTTIQSRDHTNRTAIVEWDGSYGLDEYFHSKNCAYQWAYDQQRARHAKAERGGF